MLSRSPFFISEVNHSFLYTFLYSANWDNCVTFLIHENPTSWLLLIIYWVFSNTEILSSFIVQLLLDIREILVEIWDYILEDDWSLSSKRISSSFFSNMFILAFTFDSKGKCWNSSGREKLLWIDCFETDDEIVS